jgi:hypothetical protein
MSGADIVDARGVSPNGSRWRHLGVGMYRLPTRMFRRRLAPFLVTGWTAHVGSRLRECKAPGGNCVDGWAHHSRFGRDSGGEFGPVHMYTRATWQVAVQGR